MISFKESAPNTAPDHRALRKIRERQERLSVDPRYRAEQKLKAQIAQSNSVKRFRNTAVSLPKFSWDKES